MTIARIETLVCHARMQNRAFAKALTDQKGLFVSDNATLEWHA